MATVLIVDDMQHIRRFMVLNLANSGHVVLEAEDAQHAFQILADKSPSVIVLDLALPEMDGFQFLESLYRQKPGASAIPVILVTATEFDEKNSFQQEKFKTISEVILKPFEMKNLIEAIDRALTRSQS